MEIDSNPIDCTTIAKNKDDVRNINSIKILSDIKSLGSSDKGIIIATQRTYLDLSEVRKYEEVSYHCHSSNVLYLKAKKKFEDPEEIIIPILSARTYSFKDFEEYQKLFNSNSINIAVCDSNSIAIYKLIKN